LYLGIFHQPLEEPVKKPLAIDPLSSGRGVLAFSRNPTGS